MLDILLCFFNNRYAIIVLVIYVNKKIVIILGIIVLVGFLCIWYYVVKPKSYFKNVELKSISYSSGGGYGTVVDTATMTIMIYNNGLVTFTNSYNTDIEESFYISENEYKDLEICVMDNSNIFINKPKENHDVMDGSSSSVKFVTTDDIEYTVDGYMIDNDDYDKITKKILDVVDSERFFRYRDKVRKSGQVD